MNQPSITINQSLSVWSATAAALCSGILLALAFPLPGMAFLAWIAFVPLLVACNGTSPRRAFRLGMVAGFTAYAGILYWLNIVMTTYGKLPLAVSISLALILAAYLALYVGGTMALVSWCEGAGVSPLVSFPLIWTALEYIRSFLLTGFPWASLAYSQYRTLPLIQVADLAGIYGLGCLIAFANVVAAMMFKSLVLRDGTRYPARSGFIFVLLLLAVLGYGAFRLNAPETGRSVRVALVQGNIPQDIKWSPSFQQETVAIYERLSRTVAPAASDLLVWPESALPFYFQMEEQYSGRVRALARELGTSLVVGSPAFEKDGTTVRYLNSAFLIGPAGEILGRGDKVHLVPFGEYVPLAGLLPFVHKLVEGVGDFSPGRKMAPLTAPFGKLGVLVCFEGIFPEISREYVRQGAQLLVNITNDAWYGRSSAPAQHLSMSVFRAVENRVPLVRAANTGITSVIDSKGHFQGMTRIFLEAVLTGEVRLGTEQTIYNRYGDLFAWGCLAATAVLAGMAYRKRREG